MADRRGLAVLVRASARQARPDRRTGKTSAKKGPLAGASGPSLGRKRPRRAAGMRPEPHCRAAAICHRAAQKARFVDVFLNPLKGRIAAGRAYMHDSGCYLPETTQLRIGLTAPRE